MGLTKVFNNAIISMILQKSQRIENKIKTAHKIM